MAKTKYVIMPTTPIIQLLAEAKIITIAPKDSTNSIVVCYGVNKTEIKRILKTLEVKK